MNTHAEGAPNRLSWHGSGALAQTDASEVLWLDVTPEGGAGALDRAARTLHPAGPGLAALRSLIAQGDLPRALDAANCRHAPQPTVLRPASAGRLQQINVLPLEPGRVRIVLFLAPRTQPAPAPPRLSARERAVLDLLAAGLRRDRIAWRLNISLPTVDLHARNLRRKLSAGTTSEAIAHAMRLGLIAPPHKDPI